VSQVWQSLSSFWQGVWVGLQQPNPPAWVFLTVAGFCAAGMILIMVRAGRAAANEARADVEALTRHVDDIASRREELVAQIKAELKSSGYSL
jgi:hypothetical protein